jgi:hypothetical protein
MCAEIAPASLDVNSEAAAQCNPPSGLDAGESPNLAESGRPRHVAPRDMRRRARPISKIVTVYGDASAERSSDEKRPA